MRDTSNTKIGMTEIRFLGLVIGQMFFSGKHLKSFFALSKAAGGYN